jgi:hypothetical protein
VWGLDHGSTNAHETKCKQRRGQRTTPRGMALSHMSPCDPVEGVRAQARGTYPIICAKVVFKPYLIIFPMILAANLEIFGHYWEILGPFLG